MDTNNEEWKDVPGYEERYQVSNCGSVRSKDFKVQRSKKGSFFHKGKLMSLYTNPYGYKAVGLTLNGKKYTAKVHRLVAKAFIPNPGDKRCVNHIDGHKLNNAVSNLEWCTIKENVQHAQRIGLNDYSHTRGENNAANKLTRKQILSIVTMLKAQNHTLVEIATQFDISRSTIQAISKGRIWDNLTGLKTNPIKSTGNKKLTNKNVLSIVAAYGLGCFTYQDIANAYHVSRSTIKKIFGGQLWSSVTGL